MGSMLTTPAGRKRVLLAVAAYLVYRYIRKRMLNRPPGPWPAPIIGNFYLAEPDKVKQATVSCGVFSVNLFSLIFQHFTSSTNSPWFVCHVVRSLQKTGTPPMHLIMMKLAQKFGPIFSFWFGSQVRPRSLSKPNCATYVGGQPLSVGRLTRTLTDQARHTPLSMSMRTPNQLA